MAEKGELYHSDGDHDGNRRDEEVPKEWSIPYAITFLSNIHFDVRITQNILHP